MNLNELHLSLIKPELDELFKILFCAEFPNKDKMLAVVGADFSTLREELNKPYFDVSFWPHSKRRAEWDLLEPLVDRLRMLIKFVDIFEFKFVDATIKGRGREYLCEKADEEIKKIEEWKAYNSEVLEKLIIDDRKNIL